MKTLLILALFILILQIFLRCGKNSDVDNKNNLSGSVDSICFNFVVDKWDYCREPRVYFFISLHNNSKKNLSIDSLFSKINFCNIEETKPVGRILNGFANSKSVEKDCLLGSIGFVSNNNEHQIVAPNDSITITGIYLKRVKALSLKEMITEFDWVYEEFNIEIFGNHGQLTNFNIVKDSACEIVLRLDDEHITHFDTINLNRKYPEIPL